MLPLHYAVEKSHLGIVKFLIDNGAVTEVANDSGQTVIHLSVESGEITCLELLVKLMPKVRES